MIKKVLSLVSIRLGLRSLKRSLTIVVEDTIRDYRHALMLKGATLSIEFILFYASYVHHIKKNKKVTVTYL
jgi:hypothetical protein